ncbi:hypothetical protein FOPG_03233 [Fusarium oxysporum f. sp. conglutinans race 2 54008]|uniref:Zn(2)-C6 fungal-type domain-containing protein n=1 Tax=Fusarium oxysporum f. sp. conglutinans race 2 54008 TaxID=1089457 RepID=X0ILE2_FUSOX|nr:hypothetical protein FOPG_03233 [Fusarium oxysporum f. sp. conglutinans race 2 54008]
MDPAPPDSKRPRLSSWPVGTPQQGVSLPHPHAHQLPPPPPPPPPPGALHHPPHPPPSPYQHYPPRPIEHSSAPPTPSHAAPAQPLHDTDRRHHEPEPYPPVQDYHRQQQQHQHPPQQHPHPPPSPAHPAHHPYPPYGPRDPPIKRDPAEDQRRPNSTGHAPEGMSSTPHLPPTSLPPPPPPGAYPDNPPRHMNYEGAPSMPPTPGGYRAPSFPPPTPVPHQTPYEQHGGYPSTPHEPFYSVYSSSVPAKKKNTRASQACDSCRQLKAKCDETKPCKTCKEKGVECKYRDPVPKATDKAQADILEGLGSVQTSLNSIMTHLGRFDQRLIKMESLLPKHIATSTLKTESSVEDEYKRAPASPYVANGASVDPYYNDAHRDHPSSEPMPLRMMAEDEMEVEPGPPVPPGEPAIPINHTTLAGLLLEWPSIRELTKHHVEREGVRYISEYPISQEQNRGVLIVYGRGEDSHPSRHVREPTDHGNLDMADDSSDMASPSPAADWGQLGGLSPPDQVEYKGGVLVDGNPDFSEPKLGRPMESFAFIHRASHKLQVIMRPSLDKMRRIKRNSEFIQETKYNQLALTFWTCLQLESDLIAEMQLPPSGLLSYEDDMPHPNMSLLEGFNQRILDSYPGQLYLRTHLNSIHRMFYAPEDPAKPGKDKFRNVGVVSDAVSGMHWVAPSFAFREDDPPADDILAARLRAKYWGAQVITYRPFIRQILQFSHSIKNHASSPNFPSVSSEFRQDITAPVIHPKARTHGDIDPQVVELAKKGIKALIESTRAFHGLGDRRPIITNVFGTAHAQWGNLLILSAAFRDPILHTYVDEELLRTLFHKTIQFLRQSATATSALRTDMHILEGLQRDLFSYDPRTNSSFSSGTSAPGYHTPRPVPMAAPPQMPHQMGDQGHPRSMPHHLQMNSSHGQ